MDYFGSIWCIEDKIVEFSFCVIFNFVVILFKNNLDLIISPDVS